MVLLQRALRWRERQPPAVLVVLVLRQPGARRVQVHQVAQVAPVAPKDQVVHGALVALAVLRAPVGPKVQVAPVVQRAQVALVALAVPRVQLVRGAQAGPPDPGNLMGIPSPMVVRHEF